jgi:hypothetical protein
MNRAQIEVGSQVRVHGRLVTVTKIAQAICHGVGPSLNGHSLEHIYWTTDKGEVRSYPKRFARMETT